MSHPIFIRPNNPEPHERHHHRCNSDINAPAVWSHTNTQNAVSGLSLSRSLFRVSCAPSFVYCKLAFESPLSPISFIHFCTFHAVQPHRGPPIVGSDSTTKRLLLFPPFSRSTYLLLHLFPLSILVHAHCDTVNVSSGMCTLHTDREECFFVFARTAPSRSARFSPISLHCDPFSNCPFSYFWLLHSPSRFYPLHVNLRSPLLQTLNTPPGSKGT